MTSTPAIATPEDHQLAVDIARATGKVLMEVREHLTAAGTDHREFKDAGDDAAQALIAEMLAEHRPDDAVLS